MAEDETPQRPDPHHSLNEPATDPDPKVPSSIARRRAC